MDTSRFKEALAAQLAAQERRSRIEDLERELAALRGEPFDGNRAERRRYTKSRARSKR